MAANVQLIEHTIRLADGTLVDYGPRCWKCRKKLAEMVGRPWLLTCERCHATNANPREEDELLTPSALPVRVSEIESP